MEAKHQKVVGAYTFLKELGKGQFGVVSLCCKTDNPAEQYAIKVIEKKMLANNAKLQELFRTEVKIMKFIKHPNVVHCYDFLETGIPQNSNKIRFPVLSDYPILQQR
jgi:serine/threonine protein kinase